MPTVQVFVRLFDALLYRFKFAEFQYNGDRMVFEFILKRINETKFNWDECIVNSKEMNQKSPQVGEPEDSFSLQ